MKLIAMNHRWAVCEGSEAVGSFDTYAALEDLLRIKTYSNLVAFLQRHACNSCFAVSSELSHISTFKEMIDFEQWNPPSEISLAGDLVRTLAKVPDIDYLDSFSFDEVSRKSTSEIFLSELLYFKDTIAKLLRLGAVANGAPPPADLFHTIDPQSVPHEWSFGAPVFDVQGMRAVVLESKDCALNEKKGLFDSECTSHGILDHLHRDALFTQIDGEIQVFSFENAYPFSKDGVIYEQWGEDYGLDFRIAAIYRDDFDPALAQRLLAARVTEAILNSGIEHADGYDFTIDYSPYSIENLATYGFSIEEGFFKREAKLPVIWYEALYEEAVNLIVGNKVSLCPNCGSPVLTKDLRGRKPRTFCSDSCKTIASAHRKERTIALAASGLSIDQVIKEIGNEYEGSVRKWFKDATALIK